MAEDTEDQEVSPEDVFPSGPSEEDEAQGVEAGAEEAGDGLGDGDIAHVLDQDEIDSLLGIGGDGDGADEKSGVQAILNSALVSYERLPMLEVVFDRLVRMMSTSLRNFTSDTVEVTLDSITSARFGDYLNSIPLPAMLTVFKAEEWDNYGLMVIDSSLIYSIVDVLLGGRRGNAAMRIEGRPFTTIERNLVERMIHVVLGDLSAAFDPLSPVTFRLERLETNPRFATIARPANAVIITHNWRVHARDEKTSAQTVQSVKPAVTALRKASGAPNTPHSEAQRVLLLNSRSELAALTLATRGKVQGLELAGRVFPGMKSLRNGRRERGRQGDKETRR